MKRLILMGGRPWEADDKGKMFAKVLFRYFPKQVKLAFCIFAQPDKDWETTTQWNTDMFDSFKAGREIEHKIMTAENFLEVSKWADIVYIPGGDPFTLKKNLEACGDIAKLWDDKVIAGSSAGADLFCVAYTYLQDKTMGQGLGWVQATCIPHWRDRFENYTDKDWDWAEQESLKQYPNLPVLTIPEGEFVEFTVK